MIAPRQSAPLEVPALTEANPAAAVVYLEVVDNRPQAAAGPPSVAAALRTEVPRRLQVGRPLPRVGPLPAVEAPSTPRSSWVQTSPVPRNPPPAMSTRMDKPSPCSTF